MKFKWFTDVSAGMDKVNDVDNTTPIHGIYILFSSCPWIPMQLNKRSIWMIYDWMAHQCNMPLA